MKHFILCFALLHCGSIYSQDASTLEGTWELKSFINHNEGETGWTKKPSNILYQKHISGEYFTWVKYNLSTQTLEGMGGGSFEIDSKGRYVENLDFFYPPGASELGQSIPFAVKMKGKNWYHTGYAKVFDIGIEGESVVVDSAKIEETWTRVKGKSGDVNLIGTWELTKYQETPETGYMVYPSMIGYFKILTPTHFVWVKYDKEGDQIYAAASGTYSTSETSYSEKILMQYPDKQLMGVVIDFEKELSGNQWKHFGTLKLPNGEEGRIDEFWRPLIESANDGFDID